MTTCCPNCSSTGAVGTDFASACVDCASVSVAGASVGMSTLLAATAVTGAAVLFWPLIRRAAESACRVVRPALAAA